MNRINVFVDYIPLLLMAMFLIFTPLMVKDEYLIQPLQNAPQFFAITLVCLLFALLLLQRVVFSERGATTLVDILFVGLLVCIGLRNFQGFSSGLFFIDIESWVVVLTYWSVRFIKREWQMYVLAIILLSALLQAVYGQLQLYGVCSSHHHLYGLTGSFFNPAPFSGYLCLAFPIALYAYINSQQINVFKETSILSDVLKYSILTVVLAILIVLPATRSRAAWLSVGVVSFLIVIKNGTMLNSLNQRLESFPVKKSLSLGIIAAVVVLFLVGIYWLKKDSADGRLFIWQASAAMLKEKPLTGWGKNGFESFYMLYQADFFRDNPQHSAVNLADNVQYAYNEVLKLGVEYGVVALVLLLFVCIAILKVKNESPIVLMAKYGLLAIVVFSLFSYPSDILAIKMNAVILLGFLASHSKDLLTMNKKTMRLFFSILLGAFLCILPRIKQEKDSYYEALSHWNDASDIYRVEAYEESLEDFALAYPCLCQNGNFLIQYGKALSMAGKDSLAVELLVEAKDYLNNTILYTALGDSYSRMRDYKTAETAYYEAYYMVPNRFYPLYLLAKMYEQSGQKDKALAMVKQIENKPVKVDSRAIEEIKEEMLKLRGRMNIKSNASTRLTDSVQRSSVTEKTNSK